MGKNGGTKMHCPSCKKITVCAAIPLTQMGHEHGQRWYRTDHEDINWFRRGRMCSKCFSKFVTSEIDESFITELVELRDALSNIKQHAEKYCKEAEQAAVTLKELSESLDVLKALKIYEDT